MWSRCQCVLMTATGPLPLCVAAREDALRVFTWRPVSMMIVPSLPCSTIELPSGWRPRVNCPGTKLTPGAISRVAAAGGCAGGGVCAHDELAATHAATDTAKSLRSTIVLCVVHHERTPAIHSSTSFSSTASVIEPLSMHTAWKSFALKRGPSAFSARARSSRNLRKPMR